jgi:hypothetical protein
VAVPKLRWSSCAVACCLTLGCVGLGTAPSDEPVAWPSRGDHTLARVAWLAGSWISDDGQTEEHWTAARAGMMLGVNRTHRGDTPVHHEFLMLVEEQGRIEYRAFPVGQAPTVFVLRPRQDDDRLEDEVVFVNPTHDYPQRVIYRREGPDHVTATIEGNDGWKAKRASWRFARMR